MGHYRPASETLSEWRLLLPRIDSGPKLDDGLAKVQRAVILKRFRRRGHSFKSHPTDWEKPGIRPGPPGLQGIGFWRRNALVFCRVPWLLPVLTRLVFGFSGSSHAQMSVVLVLKRPKRPGHGFKPHLTDWEEKPGIELATPGLHGIG